MFLHVDLIGGLVLTTHTGNSVLYRTINILHETKECASTIRTRSSRYQATISLLMLSILKPFQRDFFGWALELSGMA
jgi:hypothetical protein